MKISDRVQSLSPSMTLALVARTKELRAAGRDIVSLGAGEPDFQTPRNVREAAAAAIEAGHTRYTEVGGVLPLREAIARQYKQHALDYTPAQVLVSSGAKHSIFQALFCLLDPGDEVLIPAPYWLSYPEMVKACGGKPVFVECDEDDGFILRPGRLAAACGPRTRALILNPVSNPTGAVHSADDLEAIAQVCEEHDLSVISDEIYERLLYPPAKTLPFAAVTSYAPERTITISGVSKTFAMTGWRIGYAAGPSDVITAMRKHQGQTTSNACSIAQHAALEALTGPQEEIERMHGEFGRRRLHMVELLRGIPDLHVTEPQGAFYVFPRVDAFYGRREGVDGSIALAEAMLEDVGVAVVPGMPFGSDAHIRLSYACSIADIDEAVGRLAKFFATL